MIQNNLEKIKSKIPFGVTLIAVSKTYSSSVIQKAYELGIRDFGENKVQELEQKYPELPKDIQWHLIGHLQSNKVKFIAPYIHLIHTVDSLKLLIEINKQALKNNRSISVLLQFYIAKEETKFGLNLQEAQEILESQEFKTLHNIKVCGIMGMASFIDDIELIRNEFKSLRKIFSFIKEAYFQNDSAFKEISMGMSGDYITALEEGSTMVRIGTLLFGNR